MKTETLYYREGPSDKQYTATLDGRFVNCAWGRRGGTMQTKTYGPFSNGEAEAFWTGKLNDKKAKGYQPGPNATPVVDPAFLQGEGAGRNGAGLPDEAAYHKGAPVLAELPERKFLPMLLNEIDEAELLQIIFDPDWRLEKKMDGIRCLLHKTRGGVIGLSRTQKPIALPETVVSRARILCPDNWVMDGELVGDTFYAFDILSHNGRDLRPLPWLDRHGILLDHVAQSSTGIVLVDAIGEGKGGNDAKFQAFGELKAAGAEGVVLKKVSAPYQTLRPNSGGVALKFKFVQTASVIVAERKPGTTAASKKKMTARSVDMRLDDGTPVGSVTIPPNKAKPRVGTVVECRYLYRHSADGHLIQAVYLGVRTDVEPKACTAAQFKVKNTPPESEE